MVFMLILFLSLLRQYGDDVCRRWPIERNGRALDIDGLEMVGAIAIDYPEADDRGSVVIGNGKNVVAGQISDAGSDQHSLVRRGGIGDVNQAVRVCGSGSSIYADELKPFIVIPVVVGDAVVVGICRRIIVEAERENIARGINTDGEARAALNELDGIARPLVGHGLRSHTRNA